MLDLRGGSCTNQANVQIYEDNGTPAQRWNFNAPEYYAEAADILFIGDSRTQGMEENVLAGADCYYKGAKGYSYMTGYALPAYTLRSSSFRIKGGSFFESLSTMHFSMYGSRRSSLRKQYIASKIV